MWNCFEKDKPFLKNQYENQIWLTDSGMPADVLQKKCADIAESMSGENRQLIKAKIIAYILENAQIYVNPHDLFQAQVNHGSIVTKIRSEWLENAEKTNMGDILGETELLTKYHAIAGICDFGHVAPDWEAVIKLGIPGLIERLDSGRKEKNLTEEQKCFFEAGLITYKALRAYIGRLAHAVTASDGFDERRELVAKTLRNICASQPSNFLEAMQLVHIFYYVLTWIEGEGIRSLGRPDKLLVNFYREDRAKKIFTESELREIIDYFYYEMFALHAVANSPFCVCGKDSDGKTYINELSYVLIEEYVKCDINDPKIHVRYSEKLPSDFVNLVLKAIAGGNNSFVFINDDVAADALMKIGIDKEDAFDYAPIGCYEPSACGKEIPCSSAGRINLLKAVEYTMSNGVDTMSGDRVYASEKPPQSFDEFYGMVKKTVGKLVDAIITLINKYEENYMQINPSPLLSGTMYECVKNGRDVYAGGAKYNNTSMYVFGLADLADSVIAVKKLVFEDKVISYEKFCEILRDNWENEELLNLKCRNMKPKYGNNEAEPDEIAADMAKYVSSAINGRKNSRGGVYRCGLFSIDMYQHFGETTGATPNGRKAGEWFAKNLSPTIGNDKNGITSLINSVTKIDFTDIPNGSVLDLVLHSSSVSGAEGLHAMCGILKTFMYRGGMAVQFNVLNPEKLKDAMANPEKYPNLQVRLCGWNVYFSNLSKGEQNEFIKMASHSAM